MPIVVVKDLLPATVMTHNFSSVHLKRYSQCREEIKECFAKVKELKLSASSAKVKFEHSNFGDNDCVFVEVCGLIDKPERTKEARDNLAEMIRLVIKKHCNDDEKFVLVTVPIFDFEKGGMAGVK